MQSITGHIHLAITEQSARKHLLIPSEAAGALPGHIGNRNMLVAAVGAQGSEIHKDLTRIDGINRYAGQAAVKEVADLLVMGGKLHTGTETQETALVLALL